MTESTRFQLHQKVRYKGSICTVWAITLDPATSAIMYGIEGNGNVYGGISADELEEVEE